MNWILDVLRGAVIGLANVIPGVSGGTMMVSMGVYDKIIYSINHLLKKFRECFRILLPYLLGMLIAIGLGAVVLETAFGKIPLQTSALFIGLILGSVPIILKQMKGVKINAVSVLLFLFFAAVVIVPKIIANQGTAVDQQATLDVGHLIIYFLLGMLASAAMVIPGVSGSMMLMIFGYYKPIVSDTLGGTIKQIAAGDWSGFGHMVGVLIPLGIGIVVGIFGIAKLIEFLLKKWKGYTYCAILGMVLASPAVILMDKGTWQVLVTKKPEKVYAPLEITPVVIITAVIALAIGVLIAMKLGKDPEPVKE